MGFGVTVVGTIVWTGSAGKRESKKNPMKNDKTTGFQAGRENRNNLGRRFGIPEMAFLAAGSQGVRPAGNRAVHGTPRRPV